MRNAIVLGTFTAALLVGAGLLFTVEPMVAKMLLPVLGGSPSVWTGCMLFYQAALLAGYALAHGLAGRAKVVKLNVDDNMGTSSKYNIRGIPTLLLFKDGQIKDQVTGSTSRDNITRLIEAQLQQPADA